MTKNVPEIRFKGFSCEWDENNLGELIDVGSAARVHKEQWTQEGVPFFRTSDVVSFYKGKKNKEVFISHELYQELSEKIGKVTSGDLLITGGGTIGIPYLVTNEDPLYFKDADLLWLKNNQKLDGNFLYTFFFSLSFKKHIKSISHIGTIGHYTISQAKSTPISTCERNEQTQIGNYFQKLERLISQQQQKYDKLRNIKKAMLEKMFPKLGETVPEIRFEGFREDWDEIKFTEIFDAKDGIRRGPFGSAIKKDMFVPVSNYVVYEQQNAIYDKYETRYNITKQKYHELISFKVVPGDFIMSGAGTIGRISRVPEGVAPGVFNQALIRMKINEKNIDSEYFLQWIRSEEMQNRLTEANPASAMVNLVPMSELKGWDILIPKKEEQGQIGNYFQKLDVLINQHQQKITKLKNIKQACLTKMFV
ncbi:MAG: type I restriction enzyme S subunit [Oceanospirillaceae bacterium]|jgi:type I restriction enzyme S subunit